ncbi:MAG: Uma2 family endonuclease [Planctomycetota bacterium]
MASTLTLTPTLRDGEQLLREDFMDRWEALPTVKFAELIGGTVFLRQFPLSLDHSDGGGEIYYWLKTFTLATPGCFANSEATWYMRDDAPAPECSLRILPEFGGQSSTFVRNGKRFGIGAPELVVEVSLATLRYDMSVKKELYRKAGVREFICVQPEASKIQWFRLGATHYVETKPKAGIYRSTVFPGLWLDGAALLAGESARILDVLRDGLKSPEHTKFKTQLAARKKA